ncbi:MAG: VWA domain-containing protein [Deltaproteobacteria bacterium]|nr:VWA domain-containing protein [Deltaproteobacteria bacterium]
MSLAQPLALVLLALVLPVVVAYFHRRRKTPMRVPSAILFRVIAGQATPASRAMARPRHLLSLLLLLLVLLALVAALTNLQRDDEKARNYIIVLDTSASMGATALGDDTTRLQRANERLRESLSELGQQDRVALITAADHAVVRVGLTEDHSRVLEVAAAQTPSGTSDGAPSALRIADAMCHANELAAVIMLSDGVGVSAPSTRCAIEHVPVGRLGPNVGISALSVREADALGLAEVYLAVTSDLEEPAETEVELLLDDQLVEVVPLDLPAEGEVKRLLRIPLPPGRRLTAKLREGLDDVLSADDIAWAPRRVGGRISTLLVTDTRLSFTSEALRLHPRVDLSVIGPNDQTPAQHFDLVVLETARPASALPDTSHVVAMGVPAADLGFVPDQIGVTGIEIVRWSFDDPVFRFVRFDEVQIPVATTLVVGEGQTALIDSDKGPVAVSGTDGHRQVIAFGFLPHASDFVLRVGFVNLVANLVEWAAPQPVVADGTEAEAFALPAIESHVDPPVQVSGTTRGEFSGPVRSRSAMWQVLGWLAAALLAFEWLLPAFAAGVGAVWIRLRRRGTRSPRRTSA